MTDIVPLISDVFEMIAALAALGVAFLMYKEIRRGGDNDRD